MKRFYLLRGRPKNGELAWEVVDWEKNKTVGDVRQLPDKTFRLSLWQRPDVAPLKYEHLNEIRIALQFML